VASRTAILVTVTVIAVALALAPPATAAARPAPDLAPYRGPGAWIDIFDRRLLLHPEQTVASLTTHGVSTLYLETANWYRVPRNEAFAHPGAVERLVDAAHASGMKIVAWYLPGFADLATDLRRSLAAIRFTTSAGQRFDSFAMDIEASLVHPIAARNRRLILLSHRIRRVVGPSYPLGAIVPDDLSTTLLSGLWPFFPYPSAARIYDVFLPMSYSTNRGRGGAFVYAYTRANMQLIRARSGRRRMPIHVIGGLANRMGAAEDSAVIRAAGDGGALGASFYKVSWSGAGEWAALSTCPFLAACPS
jgi:hypothetical protein